jgi:glycosyltransferase involved in cell wall biosynthesis/predicted O-methyltransferase YrrM
MDTVPDTIELFGNLKKIVNKIPADFGGGSPLCKTFLMAYIAMEYNLKNYVEIGVYRGRSFFPMAYAAKLLHGRAYGIDAYDYETAKEYDLDEDFGQEVNNFLASTDFSQIYEDVKNLRRELVFTDNSEIIKEKSNIAIKYFRENGIAVDMLHIDGNHDTQQVLEDVNLYLPLIRNGGFIVIDDVNWASVKPVLNKLKKKYDVVFNNGLFAILSVGIPESKISIIQRRRYNILHSLVENIELNSKLSNLTRNESSWIFKISVVVISYNQEKYIAECLEGIFAQKGDFNIELVIGDDASQDGTLEVIRNYVDNLCNDRIEVKILPADKNIGMTKNLQRCLDCSTGKYIAACEGDDYWTDCYKLQKQVNFLRFHPECALCFNDIYIYFQDNGEFSKFDLQQQLDKDVITTSELTLNYYIGNLSCCMYDAQFMKRIPGGLFDLYIGDWMFNIYYSQFGDIGHLKETMSVYRKHSEGLWSGNTLANKRALYNYIDEYNKFLNFEYDYEFSLYQKRILAEHPDNFYSIIPDIAITDDIFPHPLSAFRLQEFISYLKEFENIRIYSSGLSAHVLGSKTLVELIVDFKRKFPEYSEKIKVLTPDLVLNAKLLYTVFLGNIHFNIEQIERSKIPFVFTLYPGGTFGLNNPKSDLMLKRVTSSPCFRRVIVTQQVTYDYLIEKNFCTPDQIEFIFGVVTPIEQVEAEYIHKKHFGIDKDTLDICFVAYKYTERGIDKGYDVFIDIATALSEKYSNIQFHVVGGFDENVLNVSHLEQRIKFYGAQETEWFDEFYKDKDIILSPNIPFKIFEGSFDGFPTGSCIDAGLRGTAIFCTDELQLNSNFFVDGEEIVIIPHDARQVTDIIEGYYQNPRKIKMIAEKGRQKIKQLYSFEAQILPRINVLKKELEQAKNSKKTIADLMKPISNEHLAQLPIFILSSVKRATPAWIKDLLKRIFRKVRSNELLWGFIKYICPESLARIYYKIRSIS